MCKFIGRRGTTIQEPILFFAATSTSERIFSRKPLSYMWKFTGRGVTTIVTLQLRRYGGRGKKNPPLSFAKDFKERRNIRKSSAMYMRKFIGCGGTKRQGAPSFFAGTSTSADIFMRIKPFYGREPTGCARYENPFSSVKDCDAEKNINANIVTLQARRRGECGGKQTSIIFRKGLRSATEYV